MMAPSSIEPLYKMILGEHYKTLPQAVQELHNVHGSSCWRGECMVRRGSTFLSNICANLLSMPPAGQNIAVTVKFENKNGVEHWIRNFDSHQTRSIQYAGKGKLIEKIGVTTIVFDILTTPQKLSLKLRKIKAFGVPFGVFLKPRIIADETEKNGKFCFHVRASLPWVGLIIEYQGWLEQI